MKVLALELSSPRGSVAFLTDGKESFAREFPSDRKHSGDFFRSLEASLGACGKPERIVVGLGPGSYAGTRIAIAAATGLEAVTGAELLGLPSLCGLPNESREYAVIGDARRDSFFFARVLEHRCVEGPLLLAEDELSQRLRDFAFPVFSAEPLAGFPSVQVMQPSALILARIAALAGRSQTPLEPIYLREPHITQPRSISR